MLAPLLLPALLVLAHRPQEATPTLAQRLARHPYFSKLALETVESHPRYRFLVQPTGAGAARGAAIVARYAPLLDPVLARFEEEVARPLGLERRGGDERLTFVVLASKGDFTNYQGVTGAAWHLSGAALHDRALDAAILYEDVFQPVRPQGEREEAARHALVHLCQQAWYAGGTKAPLDSWVLEGMADAWARRAPEAEAARVEPSWLLSVVRDAQDEGRRWTNLRTLEELAFVGSPLRLDALFRTRKAEDGPKLDTRSAWWSFYRQASLLSQFLWEAGDGARRPLALALLRQALASPADLASPTPLPADLAPSALEREFLAWVRAAHRERFPAETVDEERLARAFERGPGGVPLFRPGTGTRASPAAPAAPATEPSAEPAPETDPGAAPGREPLDLSDATPEERFALALQALGAGRTSEALATLEALRVEGAAAGLRARVERELERARAWSELAQGFVAALAAEGGTLEFRHEGKKTRARVAGLVGGELVLEPARGSSRAPERLALEALPALELAQQMKGGGAADWVRLYPYVLAEDPRALKLLREDGGAGTALLRDAREDYPARLRLGARAAELRELGAQALPATPSEARAGFEALRAWSAAAAGLPLLERKRAAVRARASELLWHEARLLGLHTRLAGRFEALSGGRVRITYAFEDARELEDFEASLYPVFLRKGFPPTGVEREPWSVRGRRLSARGETSLRSLFDLATPLTVDYAFQFANRQEPGGNDTIGLGVCDDGKEHFLWLLGLSHLHLVLPKDERRVSGEREGYYLDSTYAVRLEHDGTHARFMAEDLPGPSLAAEERTEGALFLFCHAKNELRLERLVIEGRLLTDSFERLAAARIEAELADL